MTFSLGLRMRAINNYCGEIIKSYKNMKSNIVKLLVLSSAVLALFSCKKENELSFSPNPQYATVKVGGQTQIKVESFGVKSDQGYDVTGASWSVANTFYATVDASGVVTGRKVGTTSVIASFDNGKTVQCELTVYSDNNDYVEPEFNLTSVSEIVKAETALGKVATRTGGDYAIFRNEDAGTKGVNPFTFYFLGDVKGSVSVIGESAFDHVTSAFLADRYDGGPESFTSPSASVLANNNPYGPAVIYNSSDVNALVNAYKTASKADIETVANAENYTPAKLGTQLPFDLSGVDATAVNAAKSSALTLLNNANVNSFSELETEVDKDYSTIFNLYLAAGRSWALNTWCYTVHSAPYIGGLRGGHDESKYSATAWSRVLELDELAQDAFNSDVTFKALDNDAIYYGSKYADVATLKNMESAKSKINTEFGKLETANKSKYTDGCWATVVDLKDRAIKDIDEKMYSYSEINALATSIAKSDMTSEASYFHDVTTKEQTTASVARLDAIFSNYKESDYTAANWNRMTNKYSETKQLIEESCHVSVVNAEITEAKAYFETIAKK